VFFSHPALIALAITLLVLPGVALFSGGNLSPGVREDRSNRWVIATFGLIGLLAAYLPPTERGSGRSTEMISAGLASSSSLLAPRRRSGQSLCSAAGLAGWPPFNAAIRWSPVGSPVSSPIPVIWGCWSTRWAGRSPFVQRSECCSRRCLFRRFSRAYGRKRDCCVPTNNASSAEFAIDMFL
jgi:hypothetical protein